MEILSPSQAAGLLEAATTLGLDVLVETHDEHQVRSAVSLGATLIGVNNKDLATGEVDLTRAGRLKDHVPADTLVVAESGLSRPEDLTRVEQDGIYAFLIGEALMRRRDLTSATTQFVNR
jgi:indole-3-glycerol phosphate synthase